jgi:AcrR family transcriptional regulator
MVTAATAALRPAPIARPRPVPRPPASPATFGLRQQLAPPPPAPSQPRVRTDGRSSKEEQLQAAARLLQRHCRLPESDYPALLHALRLRYVKKQQPIGGVRALIRRLEALDFEPAADTVLLALELLCAPFRPKLPFVVLLQWLDSFGVSPELDDAIQALWERYEEWKAAKNDRDAWESRERTLSFAQYLKDSLQVDERGRLEFWGEQDLDSPSVKHRLAQLLGS